MSVARSTAARSASVSPSEARLRPGRRPRASSGSVAGTSSTAAASTTAAPRRQPGQPLGDASRSPRGHLGPLQLRDRRGRPWTRQRDQVFLRGQRQSFAAAVEHRGQPWRGVGAQGARGQGLTSALGQRCQSDRRAADAGRWPVGRPRTRPRAAGPRRGRSIPGQLVGQVPGEQQEQFAGGVVDPVRVLDHQHRRPSAAEQRAQAWTAGSAAHVGARGGGRRRQPVGQVRQQRGQHAGRRRARWPAATDRPCERVHHWAVRQGFAQWVAKPVTTRRPGLGRGGLAHQPGLAHPGFALDQDHCGRPPNGE